MQFSCKSLLQLLKMFSLYEAVMNMACRIKWMEKKNFNSIVFGEMFTISLSFHNLILLSALLYYRKELCLPVCSLLSSTSNNNKYEWSIRMSWYNLVNVNRPLLIYFQLVMNMQSIIYYFKIIYFFKSNFNVNTRILKSFINIKNEMLCPCH